MTKIDWSAVMRAYLKEPIKQAVPAEHPIVRLHSEMHYPILYISYKRNTRHVVGMTH